MQRKTITHAVAAAALAAAAATAVSVGSSQAHTQPAATHTATRPAIGQADAQALAAGRIMPISGCRLIDERGDGSGGATNSVPAPGQRFNGERQITLGYETSRGVWRSGCGIPSNAIGVMFTLTARWSSSRVPGPSWIGVVPQPTAVGGPVRSSVIAELPATGWVSNAGIVPIDWSIWTRDLRSADIVTWQAAGDSATEYLIDITAVIVP